MNSSLIILPTQRAIRHKQFDAEGENLFLPNYITMHDFLSRVCVAHRLKALDADSRVLLLLESSDFKNFQNLSIERNFFTFTKNASYIFGFFEELSAEMYDIEALERADVYGEYEEHIAILLELYRRYEKLCNQRGVLDPIFLPKNYHFNEDYVKKYKKIELYAEGHLTNFEFEVLERCCAFCEVEIHLSASRFNTKMVKKFATLGIELETGFGYIISLDKKAVVTKKRIKENKSIECHSFSENILQAAYVKKKVYDFIQKGYKPENIAVVLPNEKFADTLKLFDAKSNFNFAMGAPFSTSMMYKKLDATCTYIEQNSKENEARMQRAGSEFYHPLRSIYAQMSQDVDILGFLKEYKESFGDKKEIKIFEEELYSFGHILPFMYDMSVKSVLNLFLQRVSSRSLDDVRGGKITVMGVLETRLVAFDAVVIVDFSDGNVPKKSDKDMFLNTAIREAANLPTMSDRENLQKHYYERLINNSKEVAISFVASNESKGSRFLKQLGIKETNLHDEQDYASVLFAKADMPPKEEQEIVVEWSFKERKLSATELKTFLTCKRKYYYSYIEHIKNHEIPKDMPKEHEIGSDVHNALKELYGKKSFYDDRHELLRDLRKELENACGESELEHYLMALQAKKMEQFCHNEVERFGEGWSVAYCEVSAEREFAGMMLTGRIDRIDRRDNRLYIIDYKTGTYALYTEKNFMEATDFQLEFYYLLTQNFGDVAGCGYYDLKKSKIIDEPFLKEKLAVLESHMRDLQNIESIECSKCEEIKNCLYCEYKIMCGRQQ
ncbi:MAG: PD-(D/E)XK nuclease family protein [Sulfurimonas sp.]|uniref:PD-(D/E)XK nuclease family protein n=1 Tax=Sulfurimonas sp. TaxID=2022749 RepID=UPI00260628FF|nr:PD-(D/E)XK nuclease family protein [Sulfurimonas sp.]MDD2652978.1 PD-(D/E)XK nuclease family protein [Sulfurimonas sp.]MDD3452424.1 PD-(D/E)XK nuclease family protein [Sulfurimonas sp.]